MNRILKIKTLNIWNINSKPYMSQRQGNLQIFTLNVLYQCVACFHKFAKQLVQFESDSENEKLSFKVAYRDLR